MAVKPIIKGFEYFLERLLKGFRSVEKREPNNLEMILIKQEAGQKARDANKVIQVDFGEPFGEQIKKGMFDDIFNKMYTDYKGGPKGVMKLVESGDVKLGKADKTPPYKKSQADIEQEIMEKIKADNEKAIKAFESRNPKKLDEFNLSEDDPIGDLEKIIKGEGDTGLPKKPEDKATGGRAGYQTGNQVTPQVDPRMNLDYNTLLAQNQAQRAIQAQNRNPGIMRPTMADVSGAVKTDPRAGIQEAFLNERLTTGPSQGQLLTSVMPDFDRYGTYTGSDQLIRDYAAAGRGTPTSQLVKFSESNPYAVSGPGYYEYDGTSFTKTADLNMTPEYEKMIRSNYGLGQINQTTVPRKITQDDMDTANFFGPMYTGFDYSQSTNWSPGQPAPEGYRVVNMMGDQFLERMYPSKEEVAGLPGMVGSMPLGLMMPLSGNYQDNFQDPDAVLSGQEYAEKYGIPYALGGRAGYYTGGMIDVEPSLSDIGHGSDSLMARTRLMSPGSQATTSTGLNYLLAEDNDNIRVPFQDGLSAAKKFGNILVADETLSERAGKELESKMSEFIPNETQKEKEEKEMFEMIKDFQKFKRENPDSRMTYERYVKEKKKEKELFKNTILDLAVKYPEKKVINEAGFVDKKNLKEAIDKAELDLEISPIDGLTLKRSIDTEGEQSVTSGTFDINNFSFSSPNLEEGILTSKGDFDIGDLNLSATLDSKDSDILKSGIAFNYDDILKGELSESDGYKEGELNLNKTFPINDKFNLNLKGGSDIMITPDGKTYKSSDLTPKLSYDDGILSASIAKEIMEGGNEPNLSAGINYNDFYLKGDNLLSKKDRSGIFGYQKEYGDKDGNAFFTIGGEKNIYDDDYTIGVGGKYKFADGGRIGFSKGKLADAARRKFLKTASSVGAGIAALKTGLLGFGKEAAPVVEKVAETVSQTAQSVPPYFFRLVEKIRAMGDETMASQDKAIAKKYKDYVMEEDFAGNITITKSGEDLQGNKLEDVYMSYKVDDVALKDKDGFARVDEYEEFTARPDMEGKMKDVEPGVPDEVIEEAGDIDAMTLKKASGGIARMIGE